MKKKRYLDLMVQNRHLSQCSPDDKAHQSLRRLRHSAPITRNRASRHQDVVSENHSGISPSPSSEESQPPCEEKNLRHGRQKTEMPCRCKSVGDGSEVRVSSISPCLITQSGTTLRKSSTRTPKPDPVPSDYRRKTSIGTPKNDQVTLDHHRKYSTVSPKPNSLMCDPHKRAPSVTPKHDIGVFDHLRSGLQERHKTIVKRNKPRSSSKSQLEEEHEEVFKDKKPLKLRFKMAAKCVLVLIRWLNAIIDISDTKTIRTATEERWYTLYTSQEARRLAFNKMVYSKERAFAKVPKWASDIFESDPDSRSEHDCRRIHALLRGLKSFDKFTERIQLYMCRAFRYQSVEPGRVILRRGHVGINFYFIYSGSVFVNVEEVNTRGDHFEKTETVLVRGDSFGELALLQDIRRTATITCRETCEILVVDKETFAKVCPSIFQEELEEKEKFLSKLNLFSPKFWTKEMLRTLCNEAQIQEYKTNKVVATDRGNEEWIYICMQGKGQVVRRLLLDGPSTSKRQRIKSTKTCSRHKSTEVLVNLLEDDEPDSQSSSVTSEESDDEESKEKMLESMSLEYRKDGRRASFLTHLKWEAEIQRRKAMKTPHRDDVNKKKQEMLFTGPMTLTSLMSKDKENKASDHIYLQLDSLFKEDVFDIYSIMHNVTSPPDSDVLLVSGGARFLRIKKKNFFHVCSREGLDHARRIATSVRYPTDSQLLAAYTEKFHWDHYKHVVVDHVISGHVERKTRFKNSPQLQASIISYQRQKTLDLINTLKAHSH